MNKNSEKVGITSTIPVEIIYATGKIPVDVNNVFIGSQNPSALVRLAKREGFPDTTCSWICGLYGAIVEREIGTVIGVTGGDCSETIGLMEVLSLRGVNVIPFSYPYNRDASALRGEIDRLAGRFGVDPKQAELQKERLDRVRAGIHRLDRLLWEEDRAFRAKLNSCWLAS